MLSQSAEYSLRALVCLAGSLDQPLTTDQIANATQVPVGYLAKILGSLTRAGLVVSRRGVGGGYLLEKKALELDLLSIIHLVDPSRRIRSCPLNNPNHVTGLCPLHRRLDQAIAAAEQALQGTTIAEVLAHPSFNTSCDLLS
ncbi:MAG TPA: Rrf2 family transcriptional regulator [Tepidisphaeraceae bacterium]|nr:Rrf2 family transcriptional regulator [Tepidisphaeraceae bacterium]